jgi:hypothetical protein
MSLLRKMPQMRRMPNAFCLAGISGFVKGAQWDVSTSMLKEMPQSRLLPNEISF